MTLPISRPAVARYHSNAITSLEIVQELIRQSKALKASIERGEELGLSVDELALYDALSKTGVPLRYWMTHS